MAENWRLRKTVALIGLMGAGKTAVGRSLAAKLGAPFQDSDDAIEEAAAMSVHEIFELYGEPFFRDRETEVIARLLDGPPAVLSTGGGAWINEATRAQISRRATVVWLDPPVELLWQRVRHRDTRPLLRAADPRGVLQRLHDERAPIYALAEHRLRVTGERDISETADAVIELLARAPDALEAA